MPHEGNTPLSPANADFSSTTLNYHFAQMHEGFLKGLEQPEYVHVLLNPLPVYGLALGLVALTIALALRRPRGPHLRFHTYSHRRYLHVAGDSLRAAGTRPSESDVR